jgi:MFS family permease
MRRIYRGLTCRLARVTDNRPAVGPVAAFAALGVFWGAFGVLLPAIKAGTGASDPELGLALLAGAVGTFPAMLLAGPLADRYGQRAVGASLVAFGVVALGPALAGSPLALGAALVLVGGATGSLDVTMNAAVAELEAGGRRLMNLAHAIFSLGFLVASLTVGLARSAGASRVGVLAVVACVLVAVASLNRAPRRASTGAHEGRARLDRMLLLFGVLCALGFLVESGVESWSALHLEETLGAGAATAGLALGLFSAAMVTGRLSAQALGARFEERTLLACGASLAAAGLTVTALAPEPWVALAALFATGLGASVTVPAVLSVTGRSVTSRRGAAVSTVTTLAYLGFLIGPPVVGLVAGATSLRGGLLVLAGTATVLAAGAWAVLPRR